MTERPRALEISLRLKAARHLAGRAKPQANARPGKERSVPLEPEELAKRSPLPENNIRANKIREIEEMKTHVTPSQVALLSAALGIDLEALPMLEAGPSRPAAIAPFPPPLGDVGRSGVGDQPTHEDQRRSQSRQEPGSPPGAAG